MDLVLLSLERGTMIGAAIVVLAGVVWASVGPGVVRRLRHALASRRRAALGEPLLPAKLAAGGKGVALRGRLCARSASIQRHHDGELVAVSTAESGADRRTAAAAELELECDATVLRLRGTPVVRVGSEELPLWGTQAALVSARRSFPWRRAMVRSVKDGDLVIVRGDLVEVSEEPLEIELGGQLEIASDAPPEVLPPPSKLRYALTGLVAVVLALGGCGWASEKLAAAKLPFLGLRLAAASVAAVTPSRASALVDARRILELQIALPLPPIEERIAAQRDVPQPAAPLTLDRRPLGRYLELADKSADCERAPDFLSGMGSVYSELGDALCQVALRCDQRWLISSAAEARCREGQFETASSLYDRGQLIWGESDAKQPGGGQFALRLASHSLKSEIHAHLLAGRFESAARAIERNPKSKGRRLGCAEQVFRHLAGDAGALERLRAEKSDLGCTLMLASLEQGPARSQLLQSLPLEPNQPGVGAFEVAALVLEELATSGRHTKAFWHDANPWNVENPHELLTFPHSSRPSHPALVLALLAHFEKLEQLDPEQRTARAPGLVSGGV